MRRRAFLALGGAALAPLPVRAQQARKPPVVGLVFSDAPLADMAGPDPTWPTVRAFVHGLRDLGWIDGRTVVIERRSAEGRPDRAPAIMAELIARGVDVIVVNGASWLRDAARAATRDVPIVAYFASIDPVVEGLIASLGRPGGNLTGMTHVAGYLLFARRLQLLKEIVPGIERVGLLGQRQVLEAQAREAGSLGMTGIAVQVDRADQLEDALATMQRERVGALHILGNPALFAQAPRIVAFAAEHRLPTMFDNRESVLAGGLVSYGANIPDLFRQLAGYADRILKGAKPADLPVQQPTKFELVLNLVTAKTLGLAIPPLVLAQADEVIE